MSTTTASSSSVRLGSASSSTVGSDAVGRAQLRAEAEGFRWSDREIHGSLWQGGNLSAACPSAVTPTVFGYMSAAPETEAIIIAVTPTDISVTKVPTVNLMFRKSAITKCDKMIMTALITTMDRASVAVLFAMRNF